MQFFFTGFMGSGKTYWVKQLANALGWEFVDTDAYLEALYGQSITQIFNQDGEPEFRRKEHITLLEIIHSSKARLVACGGGLPCLPKNRELMKQHGKVLFVNEDIQLILQRLAQEKQHRPLLQALDAAQWDQQVEALYETRKACYNFYDKMFSGNEINEATFAAYILSYA
jgi:shikimate kinase